MSNVRCTGELGAKHSAAPLRPALRHDVGEANTAYVRDEVISGRGLSICGVSEVEWWAPAAAAPTSPPTRFTLALAYRNAYRKATTRVVRDFLTDQLGEIAKLVDAVPDPLRGI